ncbi:hypothetical protein ACF09K_13905 [Streptomyces sp. NPDC014882]
MPGVLGVLGVRLVLMAGRGVRTRHGGPAVGAAVVPVVMTAQA